MNKKANKEDVKTSIVTFRINAEEEKKIEEILKIRGQNNKSKLFRSLLEEEFERKCL